MPTPSKNPQCAPGQQPSGQHERRAFFGRVLSATQTSFSVFGIPVFKKETSPTQERLMILGIPVVKISYDQFQKKTRFLGLPLATRPNYRFLEQRMMESVNRLRSFSASPIRVGPEEVSGISLLEAREQIRTLPSYQLMCDTKDGRLLLEDELTIVTEQMEKLLSMEDKLDG